MVTVMTGKVASRQAILSPTGLAFIAVVMLGGFNAMAVGTVNAELAPLWGATLRFGIAAVVLLVIAVLSRTPMPRGSALTGSLLYGAIGLAATFGCIHWALVRVPPADAQTVLALVPLLTYLFAVGLGLERLRPASLVGGMVAFAGVAVIFAARLGTAVSLPCMAAIVVGAACMAASNATLKRYPRAHPVAHNAVAMTVGAALLLAASLLTGEAHTVPGDSRTWAGVAYLSLAGGVAVFSLFVYVMDRWSASAASYAMLLMPLVTVGSAMALTGTGVSPTFATGGSLVLAGVYVAGLRRHPTVASTPLCAPGPDAAIQPGCA